MLSVHTFDASDNYDTLSVDSLTTDVLVCLIFTHDISILCVGDCIGANILSPKRFPLKYAFGRHEMAGLIHCDDWVCNSILGGEIHRFPKTIYSHTAGDIYVPKSSLRFSKNKDGTIRVELQFLIPLKTDELHVGIDRFLILKPNIFQSCNNIYIISATSLKNQQ